MCEFVCMDWDLQAIVTGHQQQQQSFDFNQSMEEQDGGIGFEDISETTTILDELEELYKPFYPQTSSISVPVKKKSKKSVKEESLCGGSDEIKSRKVRRNQQKRSVVQQHVLAEGGAGVCSDLWAWRKYGQKPIKGSPYPRSYYRCSSSKGCLARKQVERSSSNPEMLIITYSADHNHAHPTRRSSLAGISRTKPQPTKLQPIEPTLLSSNTITQQDIPTTHQELMFEQNHDIVFSDEFFPNLDDLEGLLFDEYTNDFDRF